MARQRLAIVAGILLSLAPIGPATGPAGAQTDPTAPPAGPAPPPSVELVGRSPWVEPDGPFTLDLALTGPLEETTVQVVIRQPITSIDDLERSLDQDVGGALYRSPDIGIGIIPSLADGARRVTINTSVGPTTVLNARLRDPGVYPVDVRLEVGGALIATVRTPLIRLGAGDDPLPAPRLEVVADVAVAPTFEPDGRRDLTEDELERLARLSAVLGPGAEGAAPIAATIAASPDTLEALAASDDPRVAEVLSSIAPPGADRELLGLPFVPLSATALVDADLDGVLGALTLSGRAALADRFDLDVDTTIWDGRRGVDRSSGELLADLDIEHVLIDAPSSADDSPASERALVDRGPVRANALDSIDVLLVDTATSAALVARAADRIDAGNIALAELVVRDAGAGSTVIVRVDDIPEDSVLRAVLPLLAAETSPVRVAPIDVDGTRRDDDDPDERQTIELPEPSVDLSAIATRVREATTAVGTFSSLVGRESSRPEALGQRIATSVAVGVDADARAALLAAVEDEIGEVLDAITLAGQTDLNLTSRSGTLPLIVRNDNDFPVEVVLQIRSDRLAFPDGDRFTIAADEEITRVDVPVRARATGSVPTFVDILTPDGRIVLDSRQLNVRSTAVSGVGLAISLTALAVLVFWWARTWRRSRREPEESAEPVPTPDAP